MITLRYPMSGVKFTQSCILPFPSAGPTVGAPHTLGLQGPTLGLLSDRKLKVPPSPPFSPSQETPGDPGRHPGDPRRLPEIIKND